MITRRNVWKNLENGKLMDFFGRIWVNVKNSEKWLKRGHLMKRKAKMDEKSRKS
jgi:hypothetical protein